MEEWRYAGFWRRFAASLIDTVLLLIILTPLLRLTGNAVFDFEQVSQMGSDWSNLIQGTGAGGDWAIRQLAAGGSIDGSGLLIEAGCSLLLMVLFWVRYGGTPGKRWLHCRVVDCRTGANPGIGRAIVRFVGYYVSLLPFGLGFLWAAVDSRKQGFHDKLAGTCVLYEPESNRAGTRPPVTSNFRSEETP